MFRILTYTFLWILLMGVAIFASQNLLPVSITFLVFRSIQLPLGLVLVFWAGLGALAATIGQFLATAAQPTSFTNSSPSQQSAYRYQYSSNRSGKRSGDDWEEPEEDDWLD